MTQTDDNKPQRRPRKTLDRQRNRRPHDTAGHGFQKGHGKRGGRPGR